MSKTLSTRDAEGIAAAMQAGRSFTTHGSLRGEASEDAGRYERGRMSMAADLDRWKADHRLLTYVVRSYATPVAWYTPGKGWYVVTEKFSVTTGRQLSTVRRAIDLADMPGALPAGVTLVRLLDASFYVMHGERTLGIVYRTMGGSWVVSGEGIAYGTGATAEDAVTNAMVRVAA